MPEFFTNVDQLFSYELNITKGLLGNNDHMMDQPIKKIIGRFDLLGREISEDVEGIQFIIYDDGSSKKIYKSKH